MESKNERGYQVNIPGVTVKRAPMNEKEAAVYLGMSVKWLQQCRCYGRGPKFMRMGRSIRYDPDALDQYKASRTVNPTV